MRARVTVAVLLAVLALVCSGCSLGITGRALAAPSVTAGIDPDLIRGTDGGEPDRLAAATLRDLEGWWGRQFPALSGGRPFTPLAGYYSVDSDGGPRTALPPCVRSPAEVEGNAFYCPRADVIAYDRASLLPVLRQDFGESAVVVVLAHEFGHAIQQRLGVTGSGLGGLTSMPTILAEGQADCYGAAFLRAVRDGETPDLRTGTGGVDQAMAALVTFRDPVGTGADDADAHGNAFDRVTSFQLGFEGGPRACAAMTTGNRLFTQEAFRSLQDEASGGNLPLDDLLAAVGTDLERFHRDLVTRRGAAWTAPAITRGSASCDGGAGDDAEQGPVAFCADDRSVHVDTGADLSTVHRRIGDFATGALVASRFGLASLAALGRPTTGGDAGRDALCLTGAYTASVGAPGSDFSLSPGDLDEAVSLLLRDDDAARGSDGVSTDATAYSRVADFRGGVTGGVDSCLDR